MIIGDVAELVDATGTEESIERYRVSVTPRALKKTTPAFKPDVEQVRDSGTKWR